MILDVKVGTGAFMKKQVDARRLAQMMVGIGRRMDKRVQALITDMNQPLGYAVGNALEVMEVSQTLHNEGPDDLRRLSRRTGGAHDLSSQADAVRSTKRARSPKHKLADGSAYRKFRDVVQAQGGNAQPSGQVSNCFRTRPGMREIYDLARRLCHRDPRRRHRPRLHHDGRRAERERRLRSITRWA